MSDRARRAWVALACAVALAVGALATAATPRLYQPDGAHYLSLADHLAREGVYRSSLHFFHDLLQPPLFPLLAAALARVGLPLVGAGLALCLVAQALAVAPMVALARGLGGRATWAFAAVAAAVYPNLAFGSGIVLEPLFALTAATAVACAALALGTGRTRWAAASGLALGLGWLTRSETIIVVFVTLAWLGLAAGSLRERASRVLAAAALVCVVVVPYGAWMRAHLGRVEVLPKITYNAPIVELERRIAWSADESSDLYDRDERVLFSLMGDHASFVLDAAFTDRSIVAADHFERRAASGGLRADAARLVAGVRQTLRAGVHRMALLHPLLALLACVGVFAGLADRRTRGATAALASLVGLGLAPAVLSGDDFSARYLAGPLLFSVPLVARGADRVGEALAARWPSRRRAAAAGLALLLVVTYATRTARLTEKIRGAPDAVARMEALDRAVAEVLPAGARVLANNGRFALTVPGGAVAYLPYVTSLGELEDYARAHDLGFAVFDARWLATHPGRVDRALADPATWPSGWRLARELFPGPDAIRIVRLR